MEKAPSFRTMEKKKQVAASSSSSLDHLLGPMDLNSASSTSTTGYFSSIFPPLVGEIERKQDVGGGKVGNPDNASVYGMNGTSGANGKMQALCIRMKLWNQVTLVPPSFMVAKKTTPQEPKSQNLNIILRKKRKTMLQLEAIQTLLQEETGGRVLFITNTPIIMGFPTCIGNTKLSFRLFLGETRSDRLFHECSLPF